MAHQIPRAGLNGARKVHLCTTAPRSWGKALRLAHFPILLQGFLRNDILLPRGGAKFSRHCLRRRTEFCYKRRRKSTAVRFHKFRDKRKREQRHAQLLCKSIQLINTTRWLEWGTTQSMTNRTNTVNHGSSASNASEYISGLSNNTTYYFRCAAQNQYGTSYGSMLSFYTGTGGGVQATAITNLATNIGETSARLNGLGLNLSNIATDGWFEWGTSQSLGNTGSRITLGSVSSNSFYQSLFGLSPNTTYYFRAVVENSNGKAYGDILNFRMNSSYIPPVIPPEGR